MAVYLVDYENVGSAGMQGVPELTEDERVIVFFSDNADSISIDVHKQILESSGIFEFVKVQLGQRNALDFQLASYLGYLIGTDAEKHYCVVSKDLGFKPLLDFWKKSNEGLYLFMCSSIQLFKNSDATKVTHNEIAIPLHTMVSRSQPQKQMGRIPQRQAVQKSSAPKSEITLEDVLAVAPEFAEEQWLSDIVRFINGAQHRADLYNRIRNKFGQDKGCIVYNKIKRFI